ncbi:MAG: hypothetical protein WCS28_12550 [Thiomicrospira sp.]
MAVLTVRSLADEVVFALKARAKAHGRSTEAEVREILREAVMPSEKVGLGFALQELAQTYAISDSEVDGILAARDKTLAEPLDLS